MAAAEAIVVWLTPIDISSHYNTRKAMANYIAEHRSTLSLRHYIRKAAAQNYWFDFSADKVDAYRAEFEDAFCLVIFGSDHTDDAYVMPYSAVSGFFVNSLLDTKRRRWIGNVRDGVISIGNHASMSVAEFYNAFEHLDDSSPAFRWTFSEEAVTYSVGESSEFETLKSRIRQFNERYKHVIPERQKTWSSRISRPNSVTEYVKRLNCHICQICGVNGFKQANGTLYAEAHHIIELHELIPGSYCSDNIVVVCSNCHSKLHYADVAYTVSDAETVEVTINGTAYRFKRTIVSA